MRSELREPGSGQGRQGSWKPIAEGPADADAKGIASAFSGFDQLPISWRST